MNQPELFQGYTEDTPDTILLYNLIVEQWREDIGEQIASDGCAIYSTCEFKGKKFEVLETWDGEIYLNSSLIYRVGYDTFNDEFINKIKRKVKECIISNKYQIFQ